MERVNGDKKYSYKLFVGLEKEMKLGNQDAQSAQDNPNDNKVLLKYKTAF